MKGLLVELWRSRGLVDALVRRYIATRYRGSLLGCLWSFLNPLCLMAVYTLVFKYYMRVQGGPHYSLMVFAGLLPWIWTTSALQEGTSSLVSSCHLITKSMFPGHILPFVSVVASLVHFVLALPILFFFMVLSGVHVGVSWLALPGLMAVHFITLWGLALALSSLNVFYRDVQHLLGNILTFLFFLCPIIYPREMIPEKFRFWVELNPFALLTSCYQMICIEGRLPPISWCGYLVASAAVLLGIGISVHNAKRERFAEVL